jgi:UDP-GlcNAc:undecaprenyl-phosphate/decaprenyl-phosphate GlcNAc-1-phosphate transferase
LINIWPFFVAAVTAIVINSAITPILLKIAHRYSWYDDVDHRTIHMGEIPRIGGIGIVFSFFFTIVIYILINRTFLSKYGYFESLFQYWPFLMAAMIINLLGLLDDFTNLRARYKLIVQLAASLLVVFSGKYFVSFYIPFFGFSIELNYFAQIFTVLWIIGITNAVNLIDGMDGLSGGTTAIILFFMGISAVYLGDYTQALLLFILFGSVCGFIIFNFPPAKLFMGDSGSLFLGFFLACMPLYSSNNDADGFALILSISFLLIPILDTVAAIIRRRKRGIPFHSPDKEHLHHKLLKLGLSTKIILLILYSATLVLSISAYLFIVTKLLIIFYANIVLWIIMILLYIKLSNTIRE